LDRGTFALWWSVLNEPESFLCLVDEFKPSREAFFRFKKELLRGERLPLTKLALRKIAIHQMSFSGLGVMAGGPASGAMSEVASRWSPPHIRSNVEKARRLFAGREIKITNRDYKAVLSEVDAGTFVYADPPYCKPGPVLYQHAFDENNHRELRSLLADAKFRWLLTYDDCPEVRKMYEHDTILEMSMTYTINGIREKKELVITPQRSASIPSGIRFQEPLTTHGNGSGVFASRTATHPWQ
jgi:DNA adenine methylase